MNESAGCIFHLKYYTFDSESKHNGDIIHNENIDHDDDDHKPNWQSLTSSSLSPET